MASGVVRAWASKRAWTVAPSGKGTGWPFHSTNSWRRSSSDRRDTSPSRLSGRATSASRATAQCFSSASRGGTSKRDMSSDRRSSIRVPGRMMAPSGISAISCETTSRRPRSARADFTAASTG